MAKRAMSDDWAEGLAGGVPQAVAPPAARRHKAAFAKAVLWTVVVAFVVLVVAFTSLLTAKPPAAPDTSGFSQQKAVAAAYMVTWMASGAPVQGRPGPPLQGGVILSADGVSPLVYDLPQGAKTDVSAVLVSFTLADAYGTLWRADVAVQTDSRGNSAVASAPSLTPLPPQAAAAAQELWPGLKTTQTDQAVGSAVSDWAAKYASGNPDALRQAVGDPNPDHWYAPLTGVSHISAAVQGATQVDGASVLAVRVGLGVLWLGQDMPQAGGIAVSWSLDLLVEAADTASPRVTAWGPPGSGPNLVRFGNAINGEGRSQPMPTAPPTGFEPTPTPTPALPADVPGMLPSPEAT